MSSTNLSSGNDWKLVKEGSIKALTYRQKDRIVHIPIPYVHITKQLTSTAYAVAVGTTLKRKPTWKYGGLAVVQFNTQIVGDGFATITQKKLFLGTINIIIVPKVGELYEITLYPPSWFWDYQYIVWEYVGNTPPDIYSKIDSLSR